MSFVIAADTDTGIGESRLLVQGLKVGFGVDGKQRIDDQGENSSKFYILHSLATYHRSTSTYS